MREKRRKGSKGEVYSQFLPSLRKTRGLLVSLLLSGDFPQLLNVKEMRQKGVVL